MPYFTRGDVALYYDDTGRGDAIITTHGGCENGSYWGLTGVTARLAETHRVIDLDMRGHGRSWVYSEDKGYDVDSLADDIEQLADHLGLERFHLLTHATGGMVGLRYAMTRSERLLSLMSTDTGSATLPTDRYADPEFEEAVPRQHRVTRDNSMADGYEKLPIHEILANARAGGRDAFLSGLKLGQPIPIARGVCARRS